MLSVTNVTILSVPKIPGTWTTSWHLYILAKIQGRKKSTIQIATQFQVECEGFTTFKQDYNILTSEGILSEQ